MAVALIWYGQVAGMAALGIEPGDFVKYTHLRASGIGKVVGVGDRALVQFWNGNKELKSASDLTPLGDTDVDAGLVASLWDRPAELAPWAKDKPLKLVALALSIDGGKGKSLQIKGKLAGKDRVMPMTQWNTWWRKPGKSLNALAALPEPKYFDKSAKGNEYTLRCGIEEVPDDVIHPTSLSEWKEWLLKDVNLPTVGKNPSKTLCEALTKWPEDTIGRALMRLLWGANVLLNAPKKPAEAAASAWLNAVGSALLRWSDVYPGNNQLTERSGKVLWELAQYKKGADLTLFRAGMLSESPARQHQLERQRQEQERQRAHYEGRLVVQRQDQERQRADYEGRLDRERLDREHQEREHVAELKSLREAHEAVLVGERNEQKKLQGLLNRSNNELAANRKESRLEIRQDMLLAVGEVLQTVVRRQANSIDELAGNVEAGLTLALKAGEAELLNTAPEGKVVAPGVQVRGIVRDKDKEDGVREVVKVLLKPQVKQEVG